MEVCGLILGCADAAAAAAAATLRCSAHGNFALAQFVSRDFVKVRICVSVSICIASGSFFAADLIREQPQSQHLSESFGAEQHRIGAARA